MSSLLSTIALCAPPSLIMLVLSFVGYGVAAPKVLIAALQHLAAGIVLSAVAVEPSVWHTECSPFAHGVLACARLEVQPP